MTRYTPPSAELMDATQRIADMLDGAQVFYRGECRDALILAGDGHYLVSVHHSTDGTIHTASADIAEGWETGREA